MPVGLGLGTIAQLLPFHRSTTVETEAVVAAEYRRRSSCGAGARHAAEDAPWRTGRVGAWDDRPAGASTGSTSVWNSVSRARKCGRTSDGKQSVVLVHDTRGGVCGTSVALGSDDRQVVRSNAQSGDHSVRGLSVAGGEAVGAAGHDTRTARPVGLGLGTTANGAVPTLNRVPDPEDPTAKSWCYW